MVYNDRAFQYTMPWKIQRLTLNVAYAGCMIERLDVTLCDVQQVFLSTDWLDFLRHGLKYHTMQRSLLS